jgi:pimeloyl-ACP methyl ester carboxylesterase
VGQLVDWIGELTHPAFIMWGEQDSLIPISVGQRFYREIAHSEFISVSGLVNVPHEEAP